MNKPHSTKNPLFCVQTIVLVQFNTLPLQEVKPDREESLMLPKVQKEVGNKKEVNPDTVTTSAYRTCMQGSGADKH